MGEYTVKMPTTAVGTLTRPTTLRVPNGWKPDKTYPLCVFGHNYGAKDGDNSQDSAGLDVRGRLDMDQCGSFDDGCFSLVPNGLVDANSHKYWNASPACCDVFGVGPDDVGYIATIVQNVINADWNVDLKRIILVGYSNGAFLANALGCHHPELFTHVIGVAGAFPTLDGTTCLTTKHVSVLVIHGTLDSTVPYNGGTGGPPVSQEIPITNVCSAAQTAAFWAAVQGIIGSLPGTPLDSQDIITTGSPAGAGAESDRYFYPTAGNPLDGQVGFIIMNSGNHSMVFSTGAGMRVLTWALQRPRLS